MDKMSLYAFYLGAVLLFSQGVLNLMYSMNRELAKQSRIRDIGIRRAMRPNWIYAAAFGMTLILGARETPDYWSWTIVGSVFVAIALTLCVWTRSRPSEWESNIGEPIPEKLRKTVRDKKLSSIFFFAGGIAWIRDVVPYVT